MKNTNRIRAIRGISLPGASQPVPEFTFFRFSRSLLLFACDTTFASQVHHDDARSRQPQQDLAAAWNTGVCEGEGSSERVLVSLVNFEIAFNDNADAISD
jgi:hypothetical protein